MTGVGDKNESHVHHRTANPEFWNGFDWTAMVALPVTYSYRPPVGALMGGSINDTLLSDVEKYTATETAISGNTSFLAVNVLLASDRPAVSPKDSTKSDSTKTDTTKTDTTKTDSTKKEGIAVAPAIESFSLDIAHHGNFLDVNYVLPQAADVKISLVSIKGTAVKQFTGRQGAGGHNLQWDVAQIPAGTYLVAVRTGRTRDYRIVKIGL